MGPLLLARLLNLNETQEGVLHAGLQGRRRQRPAAARPQGPARDAAVRRRQRQRSSRPSTATSRRPRIGAIQRGLLAARAAGRRPVLRRAGARHRRPDADRRDGHGASSTSSPPTSCCNAPRLYATFLLWLLSELFEHLPEVGDPRQAEAGVLLRRGAPAVQRRAEGAARQDRAGGAADPLQGRRRLLRHAEPARHPGHGARPARQPRAARAARLHAARPEGGQGRRRDLPRQPEARRREGDHRARRRRGAGLAARRRRARPGIVERVWILPPGVADRPDHARTSASN